MEMKSISGLTFYIKDLETTSKFYETLGFRIGTREPDYVKIYLNWFSVDFRPAAESPHKINNREAGILVNIKVANVDEFYEGVVAKGLEPSSQPHDFKGGVRKFLMEDPDGNKLIFFYK